MKWIFTDFAESLWRAAGTVPEMPTWIIIFGHAIITPLERMDIKLGWSSAQFGEDKAALRYGEPLPWIPLVS